MHRRTGPARLPRSSSTRGVRAVALTALVLAAAVAPAQNPEPTLPPGASERPLPITLPVALQLADTRALDIALAAERVRVAAATFDQARVLWVPTVTAGMDYSRHDGRIQDIAGNVFTAGKGSLMFGVGSGIGSAAIISPNDAIFAPLAARQVLHARQADLRTATNDTLLAVATAYFDLEQARGDWSGAGEAERRAETVTNRVRKLAQNLIPQLEATRAEADLARRRQATLLARERVRVTGAELARLLRLDATAEVQPVEPPHTRVDLLDPSWSLDRLIEVGLTNRPELASQQAAVQVTLARLRQEKLRPLVPSVLLRGFSTPVTGTLAMGAFGGGTGGTIGNFGYRGDLDVQVLWQFDNLGLGNRARVRQQEAERSLAVLELFRLQDRIAAEVAQAHAQADLASRRAGIAEQELRLALDSYDRNLEGLGQTRLIGGVNVTVVRPQEVLAAVQAGAQAYTDFYTAVADSNRAQFRLYRALGHPAKCLLDELAKRAAEAGPATGTPARP